MGEVDPYFQIKYKNKNKTIFLFWEGVGVGDHFLVAISLVVPFPKWLSFTMKLLIGHKKVYNYFEGGESPPFKNEIANILKRKCMTYWSSVVTTLPFYIKHF